MIPGESSRRTKRQSPYERVLGDAADALHPQLRAYFGVIPEGHVGRGEGVFTTVGTPRRRVRTILGLLAPRDVLFGVWERDVAFSIVNEPGRWVDSPAVRSIRTFALTNGSRVMTDIISVRDGELIDELGARRRIGAAFTASVDDGGLVLRSHRVWLRCGGMRLSLPRFVSPIVTVIERATGSSRQAVSVTVTAPIVGRVYEYEGEFRYLILRGGVG